MGLDKPLIPVEVIVEVPKPVEVNPVKVAGASYGYRKSVTVTLDNCTADDSFIIVASKMNDTTKDYIDTFSFIKGVLSFIGGTTNIAATGASALDTVTMTGNEMTLTFFAMSYYDYMIYKL